MYCIDLEKSSLVTKIAEDFDHNQTNKTKTFTFSSDDHSRSTYKCKLDNGKFKQCELIYEWIVVTLLCMTIIATYFSLIIRIFI